MTAYRNNLRKGDTVEVSGDGRRGTVACQPRESSTRVMIKLDGLATPRYFPVLQTRLVVDGVPETVPPVSGEVPAPAPLPGVERAPVAPPSPRTTPPEASPPFERLAQPIREPEDARIDGEHLKHYIINYLNRRGEVHVEKIAAKGIVTAITLFYVKFDETAIISVVCIL